MASLAVRKVNKRFDRVQVLSDVDLQVADGEFCVLLGPSGCGKSTLLNIIAGLIPQDEGTVLFNGKAVDHLAPRERDVAMVFQSYALYPHMTVAGNLGFGLHMRGVPKQVIEESVRDVARLLGIEKLLDRKPRELSGGQRQRVAMGRALVRRPKVFLLDEPLSNLDARLRANVRLELKRIHQQIKGTVIYVTHDQVEAMTLGDRVVVMGEGRIRQAGTPEAIYAQPQDTFVASFIGTPEMNLYRGLIMNKGSLCYFCGKGFEINLGKSRLEEGEVEVGIRPEDVHPTPQTQTAVRARIEMISDIGSEKFVHLRLGQEGLTMAAPKRFGLQPGKFVDLSLDSQLMHFFRGGRRIQPDIHS
jgi:multiple sugar transport system ATP-binding protein